MTIPAFLPYFVFTGTAVTLVAILRVCIDPVSRLVGRKRIARGRSAPLPPFSLVGSP